MSLLEQARCVVAMMEKVPAAGEALIPEVRDLFAEIEALREVAARSTPKQGEAPKVCGVCFEEEAFAGTCGGGRENPRALCFQAAAPSVEPAPAPPTAVKVCEHRARGGTCGKAGPCMWPHCEPKAKEPNP